MLHQKAPINILSGLFVCQSYVRIYPDNGKLSAQSRCLLKKNKKLKKNKNMNEHILQILNGDASLYPHALEQQYERVLNKILQVWDTPEAENYLFELMVDNRGGTRQGFPTAVAQDIMALHKIYSAQHQRIDSDVWGAVPDSKRAELEQLGYTYSFEQFIKAIEAGNEAAVKVFLSCGADMESRDERDWTPLMISTFNGNEQMAQLLIRCGARVQAGDSNGYTPLHWSAFNGHLSVVNLLLAQGAQVNARSQFGWTALMQAATRGHFKIVATLLDHGAEVNATTSDGWTSLHKAAANGHTEVVLVLLEKGADSAIAYPDGSTALSLAIKNKHEKLFRILTHFQRQQEK